ncbi:hypothetical protein, partial [Tropheryma whipplei]
MRRTEANTLSTVSGDMIGRIRITNRKKAPRRALRSVLDGIEDTKRVVVNKNTNKNKTPPTHHRVPYLVTVSSRRIC